MLIQNFYKKLFQQFKLLVIPQVDISAILEPYKNIRILKDFYHLSILIHKISLKFYKRVGIEHLMLDTKLYACQKLALTQLLFWEYVLQTLNNPQITKLFDKHILALTTHEHITVIFTHPQGTILLDQKLINPQVRFQLGFYKCDITQFYNELLVSWCSILSAKKAVLASLINAMGIKLQAINPYNAFKYHKITIHLNPLHLDYYNNLISAVLLYTYDFTINNNMQKELNEKLGKITKILIKTSKTIIKLSKPYTPSGYLNNLALIYSQFAHIVPDKHSHTDINTHYLIKSIKILRDLTAKYPNKKLYKQNLFNILKTTKDYLKNATD